MWRQVYERWLMPEAPGLRQFLLVLILWVAPLCCLRTNDGTDPRVLMWSVGLGAGLGLAWALTSGWPWLKRAPVSALVVFLACAAAGANLVLVPRWDALLRAHRAGEALSFYLQSHDPLHADPPLYSTGQGGGSSELILGPHQEVLGAYTRDPILRWTPFGFHPACYVVVRAFAQPGIVRSEADLQRLLESIRQAPIAQR